MKSLSPTRVFRPPSGDRIAVIGMSARFPGAADIEEFWRLLDGNASGLRKLGVDELRAVGVSETQASRPDYVPFWGGPPDADGFDAAFFGYAPRDAELLDPQQRVFLECGWNALEDAGYDSGQCDRLIGKTIIRQIFILNF